MNTLSAIDRRKTDKNLFEFLLSVSGFNMLTYEEIEMLEKIMRVDNYSNGHKFNTTDNIYLIIDGDVAITQKESSGIMQLEHMHSAEFFGLFSLIDSSRQSAKCTAVNSVRAASLPRTAFELLFRSHLPLSLHFQNLIANQITQHMRIPTGPVTSYC